LSLARRKSPRVGPRWVRVTTVAHGHHWSPTVANGSEKPEVVGPLAHVVPHGSEKWRRYLAFRDRLRIDPDARASYAEVKPRLGERFASDRRAYTAAKAAFVAGLLSAD
jgi:GrpB-like predicted nucleotidyltransferase (UPF0157 family)